MNTRWLAYALALLALIVFGYACKSDSGGGGAFLLVLETAPEVGQAEVPLATRIGFRVNAPIDPASLTNSSFFLTGEGGTVVPATISIGDEPDIAELDPDEPLSVITTYTATITTGLRARGGATLEEDFEWTFRTLDSEWGVAEWLETVGTGTSSSQEIAVDGQLNALALWQYDDEIGSSIWANRYTRAGTWGTPQPIDDQSGGATRPALAVDDLGNGFAVWERSEDGGFTANIWTNRYDVEQGWGTAELLQSGEIDVARIPAIAADPAGNAIAVWAQRNVTTNQEVVWASRYTPGGGWETAAPIDQDPSTIVAGGLAVGMDANGNAIAIWRRSLTTGDVLWANRYTVDSGWAAAALFKTDPETDARQPRLDVSANGDAFVIWLQKADAWDDVWVGRFSGSSWDAPERIDTYDAGNKRQPDVTVDGNGVGHAAWAQEDADFENIWANQYSPQSGWGTPQLIELPEEDPNDDGDAQFPRVDVNTAGNAFVVWIRVWLGWRSVWSNRLDPGMAWMGAELIEDGERNAGQPKIAVDEDRHAHAVWLHDATGAADWVRTNRFE